MRRLIFASTVLLGLVAVAAWLRFLPGVLMPEEVFDTSQVYEISVWGQTLYVDHAFSISDAITSSGLLGLSCLLAVCAWRIRGHAHTAAFVQAALGAGWLAADDALAIHETLGHNLMVLNRLPGLDHPDDAVMAVYALVVGAWLWHNRSLADVPVRRLILVAGAIGALAVGLDLLPFSVAWAEEPAEAACAVLLLVGAIMVVRSHWRGPALKA